MEFNLKKSSKFTLETLSSLNRISSMLTRVYNLMSFLLVYWNARRNFEASKFSEHDEMTTRELRKEHQVREKFFNVHGSWELLKVVTVYWHATGREIIIQCLLRVSTISSYYFFLVCALCYAARRGRDLYTQPATSSPRSDSIKLIFPATALLRSSSFRLGRLLTLYGEFKTVFFLPSLPPIRPAQLRS